MTDVISPLPPMSADTYTYVRAYMYSGDGPYLFREMTEARDFCFRMTGRIAAGGIVVASKTRARGSARKHNDGAASRTFIKFVIYQAGSFGPLNNSLTDSRYAAAVSRVG